MRPSAAQFRMFLGKLPVAFAAAGLLAAFGGAVAVAQTVPENIRINVDPPEPPIRSVTVNKRYRPIISRDDKGVVIDTLGSDNQRPPCAVSLEVTLENSRVLHREADLCSGGTLVVDVASDGKPGQAARIVGSSAGISTAPVSSGPATPPPSGQPTTAPATTDPVAETKPLEPVTPQAEGGLEPLERVDTPISAPDPTAAGGTGVSGDLQTIVGESLARQSDTGAGNAEPILVAPSEVREWSADPGGVTGSVSQLQHGVPQTDDRDFQAVCQTQSGFAKVVFEQAPAGLSEGMPQTIQISAGTFSATYNAFGSAVSAQYGQSLPEASLPMTDPLWEALIRENELSITVEGMPPYAVSLKGSANPVRLFVATCSEPQQIVSDAAGLPGEEPNSDLSCSELGRVRSVEAERPGQIVFRNASQQAIEVNWIDYRGGERHYARLEPGQILEQQTYVSHAWSVRDAGGQCRGVYVSQTPFREVIVRGAATVAPGGLGDPFGGNGLPQNGFPAGPVPPGDVGQANQVLYPQQAGRANVADYLCTAGIDLNVVFSTDGATATVAEMGYGTVTLQRQGGANTFHYAGQGHELKGQIQNASWSRPGLRDVFCARR